MSFAQVAVKGTAGGGAGGGHVHVLAPAVVGLQLPDPRLGRERSRHRSRSLAAVVDHAHVLDRVEQCAACGTSIGAGTRALLA